MFTLDTNIISELMRDHPHPAVLDWLDARLMRELIVKAVTEAEVYTGLAFLPLGKRRRRFTEAADHVFASLFKGRILPFDSNAARFYVESVAACRAAGRPISQSDDQISAIVQSRGMVLVTRNVQDFEDMGIGVYNPWDAT
ncbi:MAG: type II toxin-antitoxin system VapC family toxin [Acidobacteria bacterium]|nr:type II toxin-antitoxin system VapC family toxin [Acidobacteriota bacterium]